MKIEQIIGANVARLRTAQGISQTRFGERIGELTGQPWSRQSVSNAERGDRGFLAADLVILATVLRVPAAALLTAPEDVETIEAGDVSIPRRGRLARPARDDLNQAIEALTRQVSLIEASRNHQRRLGTTIDDSVDTLRNLIDDVAREAADVAQERGGQDG